MMLHGLVLTLLHLPAIVPLFNLFYLTFLYNTLNRKGEHHERHRHVTTFIPEGKSFAISVVNLNLLVDGVDSGGRADFFSSSIGGAGSDLTSAAV